MAKKIKGLTIKEQKFVTELVKTGNKTEASMRAYNNKSRRNAKLLGQRVSERPRVKKAIQDELVKAGVTTEWLITQEKKIIDSGINYGKPSMSDARLSIQNLHKLYNSYPASVKKNMNLNVNHQLDDKDSKDLTQLLKKNLEMSEKLLEDLKSQ